jgi:putative ABC transport system permease protein
LCLIELFNYPLKTEWWIFIAAVIIVLLVAMIAMSFLAIKAAIANSVMSLEREGVKI